MRKVTLIFDIVSSHWFDSGLKLSELICALTDIPNCSALMPDYAVIDRLRDTLVCVPTPSLSAYRFCDLRRISHIEPNDRFLISKADYFKEMNGRVETGPNSMNISYQTLSTSLARDMNGKFDVNSMAYRNWWDYSEVNHHHDLMYNSIIFVQCVNDYLHDNSTVSVMANISCGLSTEGIPPCNVYLLSCPADLYIPMEEPAIGSVRFIAKRSGTINVDSDDFDGWVPADGTKYSAANVNRDFKDRFAKALYTFNRGKEGATSFTVPNLTGFYKFTDLYRANDKITYKTDSHCSLLSHTHYLSPNEVNVADGTNDEGGEITGFVTGFDPLSSSLYLYHSAVKDDKFIIPLMHAGRKLTDEKDYGIINLETNIVSIRGKYSYSRTTLPTMSAAAEIKLEHDVLPAMIYIGGHMKNYILYERYHNYRHRLDFMNTYNPYPKEFSVILGGWTPMPEEDKILSNYTDCDIYRSANYHKPSSVAKLTIKLRNFTTFTLSCASKSELGYDYVVALSADHDIADNKDFVYTSRYAAGSTYKYPYINDKDKLIVKKITYSFNADDHNEHTIIIGYRKDNSINNDPDRGYIMIDKKLLS